MSSTGGCGEGGAAPLEGFLADFSSTTGSAGGCLGRRGTLLVGGGGKRGDEVS